MIRFLFSLSIGVGEIKEEVNLEDFGWEIFDWVALSDEEKEAAVEEAYLEWRNNYIEGGWTDLNSGGFCDA